MSSALLLLTTSAPFALAAPLRPDVTARAAAPAVTTFTDIVAGLVNVHMSSVAWGDYDNDGDLDILLTGFTGSVGVTRLYRNGGGPTPTFSDVGAGLTGVYTASVAWGDYDNDGDLDILLAGFNVASGPVSKIYRNSGGANPTFSDVGAALTNVQSSSAAWGDYDNDGDLDILLTGSDAAFAQVTKLYRNSGGPNPTFSDVGAALDAVTQSSVAWGDYDNDGDLDILLTGFSGGTRIAKLYRNSGGANPTFSDVAAGLTGVQNSSVAWGDYDNDGDLDILLTGFTGAARISKLYRNSGGANPTFSDVGAVLDGVNASSVAWGDYDNDGDLDILLTGFTGTTRITKLYQSSGGANPTFSDALAGLTNVQNSSVAWGDYDNDGDLDILLTGYDPGNVPTSRVFRSDGAVSNSPPNAPSGLTATTGPSSMTFSWSASSDAQTSSNGLSYNLRVGTSPGGNEISSGMAAANGYRRVVRLGNAQQRLSWSLKLPPGTYYWSVQAVDGAFAGSAFAAEASVCTQSFTDIGAGLVGSFRSSMAWGDYDNDGHLDLLLTGGGTGYSRLYRNGGGANPTFSDLGPGLPSVLQSSVAWGDYDNDGDLDILLTGMDSTSTYISKLYRNSGGANPTFSDVGAGLTGVAFGSVAWGDYDNDGDLDILITGDGGDVFNPAAISKVYRNSGGANPTFSDAGVGLNGAAVSSAAWGDYDNDGDLDILLTGHDGGASLSKLYRNSGGPNPSFSDVGAGLPNVSESSVAWGDYDHDGDLDIVLTGFDESSTPITRLFRNNGGPNPTFSNDFFAGLTGVDGSSVAWGDYDNDGDLDLVLAGVASGDVSVSKLYRNNGGGIPTFSDAGVELSQVGGPSVAWGDYDNDGDLDLALTGREGALNVSKLYRNSSCVPNTHPSAPNGLIATPGPSGITFSWNAASDAQTPSTGLSYNLNVGTTPGGSEIFSAMAAASGYRQVARLGNAQERTSWTLAIPPGPYYWSVQAIDGAFLGSPFATSTVAVEETTEIPTQFELGSPVPNPFGTEVALSFALPRESRVELAVFDLLGRRVRVLERREMPAGRHTVRWDGRDGSGAPQADGIYLIRMVTAERTWVTKLVLAR